MNRSYSFGVLENQRTEEKVGRGNATYSTLDHTVYDNTPVDDDRLGTTREEVFARMKYFLERVIPTAEEWKVQLACHLCVRTPPTAVAPVRRHGGAVCRDDPPAPVLRGVERWDFVTGAERPVFEGLKTFCELVDSPYHGLNLCCG